MKFPSVGMTFLEQNNITVLVQSILSNLGKRSGELVRLSIIEDGRLCFLPPVMLRVPVVVSLISTGAVLSP